MKIKHGKLLKQAILMAEELFPEPKSGKKKKEFVVDLINSKIDLPILGERAEERLISFAIDMLVDVLEDLKK
jgi:hypothetical protein